MSRGVTEILEDIRSENHHGSVSYKRLNELQDELAEASVEEIREERESYSTLYLVRNS